LTLLLVLVCSSDGAATDGGRPPAAGEVGSGAACALACCCSGTSDRISPELSSDISGHFLDAFVEVNEALKHVITRISDHDNLDSLKILSITSDLTLTLYHSLSKMSLVKLNCEYSTGTNG
jgi:hypothetical protein